MPQMQPPQQMHPDHASASLAFSTALQQEMLNAQTLQAQAPQQPQEALQPQMVAQGEAKTPQTDKTATPEKKGGLEAKVELNMTDKLDELRKEIKTDMLHEMQGIKSMIEQALTSENEPTDETTKTA